MDFGESGPVLINGKNVGWFEPSPDGLKPAMREALESLRDFTLEYSPSLANTDSECFECGYPKDKHAEADFDCERFIPEPPSDVPFFTESYLYWLLGKDQARSVLVRVKNVLRAAGVPEKEIWNYL